MKSVIIVGLVVIAIPFLLWGLLILMGWLASFVGEGTYIPESKSESTAKHQSNDASGSKIKVIPLNQPKPSKKPV